MILFPASIIHGILGLAYDTKKTLAIFITILGCIVTYFLMVGPMLCR